MTSAHLAFNDSPKLKNHLVVLFAHLAVEPLRSPRKSRRFGCHWHFSSQASALDQRGNESENPETTSRKKVAVVSNRRSLHSQANQRGENVCASCFRMIRQAPEPLVVLFTHLAFEEPRSPSTSGDWCATGMRPRKPVLLFDAEMNRKTPKQRVTKSSGGFQPPQSSCSIQPARRTNAKSNETRLRTFKKPKRFPGSPPTPHPDLSPTNPTPTPADSQPPHKQEHRSSSQ